MPMRRSASRDISWPYGIPEQRCLADTRRRDNQRVQRRPLSGMIQIFDNPNFAVFPAAAAGRLGKMRIGFWTDTGNQAAGQPASQGVLRQGAHTAVSVW